LSGAITDDHRAADDSVTPDVGSQEIVAQQLYAIGTPVVLDGRVSWAPSNARGYMPLSGYLVIGEGQAILIDTGAARQGAAFMSQISALLPPGLPLEVFLTRSEYDCIGNLGLIMDGFGVTRFYAGGAPNPFDAFGEALGASHLARRVHIDPVRLQPGTSTGLDSNNRFELIAPSIRTLSTYWLYDRVTQALFTSDVVGQPMIQNLDSSWVVTDPDELADPEVLWAFLTAKFFWLELAEVDEIVRDLKRLFSERDIAIVAPTHGCILAGAPVVERWLHNLVTTLGGSRRRPTSD
jgi:flavorubredoxin